MFNGCRALGFLRWVGIAVLILMLAARPAVADDNQHGKTGGTSNSGNASSSSSTSTTSSTSSTSSASSCGNLPTTSGAMPTCQCDLGAASGATKCVLSASSSINATSAYTNPSISSCATTGGCYDATKSSHGSKAQFPIDVWGTCRYVDNNTSSSDLFVPFRTQPDWKAFVQTAEALGSPLSTNITTTPCARPYYTSVGPAVPLPPGATGASPSFTCATNATAVAAPVLYGRTKPAKQWAPPTQSISFSCNNGGTTIPTTELWTAGQSSDWTLPLPSAADWSLSVAYGPYVGLSASGTLNGNPASGTTAVTLDPGSPFTLRAHEEITASV